MLRSAKVGEMDQRFVTLYIETFDFQDKFCYRRGGEGEGEVREYVIFFKNFFTVLI